MKIALVVLAAAVMSGCAEGIARTDQVYVRELRAGSDGLVLVISDPVAKVTCWKSGTGMTCLPNKTLEP